MEQLILIGDIVKTKTSPVYYGTVVNIKDEQAYVNYGNKWEVLRKINFKSKGVFECPIIDLIFIKR